MTLAEHVLRRLIESAQRKAADATPVVAVSDEEPPAAPFTLRAAERDWRAVPVRSTLQARRALLDACAERPVVLLSAVGKEELGEEVMARVSQRRLHSAEPWVLVRELFGAEEQTRDLSDQGWIAEELIARVPPGGFARVPAGILDLEFAWGALLQALGLSGELWTLKGLMEALVGPRGLDGTAGGLALGDVWPRFSGKLREKLAQRLVERMKDFGPVAVALLDKGQARRALEWGLLAELSESPGKEDPLLRERVRLQVQLEAFAREAAARQAWGAAARLLLESWPAGSESRRQCLLAAEQQLRAWGVEALIPSSKFLPGAIEALAAALGHALERFLEQPVRKAHREGLEQAAHRLLSHLESSGAPENGVRRGLLAVLRLARWLRARWESPVGLCDWALVQIDQWAWVDTERRILALSDLPRGLLQPTQQLAKQVAALRDQRSTPFAAALSRVLRGQEHAGEVCFSEGLLAGPLAGLTQKHRVLLVLLDGMSAVEFEAIAEDLVQSRGFERIAPQPSRRWMPVLAPLPTVTEVCRTSLFCGRLTVGDAATERQGFGDLARSLAWIRAKDQAPLFHKAELRQEGGGLSPEVYESLAGSAKVVAVVVNAIDDWLKQGGQVRMEWGLRAIPLLAALATAAEAEGRLLVLTADHGHVLDRPEGQKAEAGAQGGERWRSAERGLEPGEARFEGPRVLLPAPGGPAVLPVIEGLRYASKAFGYHGGATAQEVVVPLGVFASRRLAENLDPALGPERFQRPWWWDSAEDPAEGREPFDSAAEADRLRRSQGQLFSAPERRPEPAAAGSRESTAGQTAKQRPAWIAELLKSPLFKAQKELAARQRPQDDPIAELLALLIANGNKLPRKAIGNHLGLLDAKLDTQLALARRLLNYDGLEILSDDGHDVILHPDVLWQQFGLGGKPR